MTLTEAVDAAGGAAAFGRTLGPPVTGQAVSTWLKRGYVPAGRVLEIEKLHGVPRATIYPPRVRAVLAG